MLWFFFGGEKFAVSILPIIPLRRIFIPRGASLRRDCERLSCNGLLHRGYRSRVVKRDESIQPTRIRAEPNPGFAWI